MSRLSEMKFLIRTQDFYRSFNLYKIISLAPLLDFLILKTCVHMGFVSGLFKKHIYLFTITD